MSRRIFIALLSLSSALVLMPQISLAAKNYVAGAMKHTQQAIEHGRRGHAKALTIHAEAALRDAKAEEKVKPNPHIEEAIKHLEQALAEGRNGNAEGGTTHAEGALRELEQGK
ncbi:MAG: hypothetical protein J2P49_10600 [Methylocapsa sp.]|nr:hypothetical protein [Methylocapsa sp.]